MIGTGPGGIALWAALRPTAQASTGSEGYQPVPSSQKGDNEILRRVLRRQFPEHRENVPQTNEQDLPKTDPEMERRKQEAFQRALEESARSNRYTLGLK